MTESNKIEIENLLNNNIIRNLLCEFVIDMMMEDKFNIDKKETIEEKITETIPSDQKELQIYEIIKKDLISALSNVNSDLGFNQICKMISSDWKYHSNRDDYTSKFSWAIPCIEAILEIKSIDNIIEIYAGTGYWASLLAKLECNITCYDNFTWKYYQEDNMFGKHHKVLNIKDLDINTVKNCNLMISWPNYGDDQCIEYLKIINPSTFIYIGEDEGGCNACDDFFSFLEENFTVRKIIKIPKWSGIHDELKIFDRKAK